MKRTLQRIYQRLFKQFGSQHWWPGETPLEVVVGAVLTQNTSWQNVEKAIDNLKAADALSPRLHRPRSDRSFRAPGGDDYLTQNRQLV